jgi:predicted enzyme related to lactoylglutathione lyase
MPHLPAPVVKWQILSPDPDATVGFYKQLFGWSSTKDNALGYRELKTGGEFDGGVWPAPPAERPFVQLFMAVPDVDAHVDRATQLGARVLVPTSVLPDGDRMAVLLDPQGMSFAVCTRAEDRS